MHVSLVDVNPTPVCNVVGWALCRCIHVHHDEDNNVNPSTIIHHAPQPWANSCTRVLEPLTTERTTCLS